MLGAKTRLDTLVLSKGQTWVAVFFPKAGATFPTGTTCECTITDPAGGVLATWQASSIADARIDFYVGTDDADVIPHGAYYRVTAHYPPIGPKPAIDENLSRGSVVRDDNPTPLAAPRSSNIALSFVDNMTGPGVDPNWVRIGGWGNLKINDNSAYGLPNGMSADFILFDTAAARYRAQTNQNACKAEVSTLLGGFGGAGKTTVVLCSNQSMTSWVGFQFETGVSNNNIHIVQGTSPTTWAIHATVANTVANNDRYTFIYDDLADNYLAYKGTDLATPLVQWQDSGHSVPHGNGYRYPGLLFQSSLLSTGVQLSGWAVKDN